jgi:ribosome modulation factor
MTHYLTLADETAAAYRKGYHDGANNVTARESLAYKGLTPYAREYWEAGYNDGKIDAEIDAEND